MPSGSDFVASETLTVSASSITARAADRRFCSSLVSSFLGSESPWQPARKRAAARIARSRVRTDSVWHAVLISVGDPGESGDRAGDGQERLGGRNAGPVTPLGGCRQLDRRAAGGAADGRPVAHPRQDEPVLALEQALAAHAAGGSALGRVDAERADLHAAGLRTG